MSSRIGTSPPRIGTGRSRIGINRPVIGTGPSRIGTDRSVISTGPSRISSSRRKRSSIRVLSKPKTSEIHPAVIPTPSIIKPSRMIPPRLSSVITQTIAKPSTIRSSLRARRQKRSGLRVISKPKFIESGSRVEPIIEPVIIEPVTVESLIVEPIIEPIIISEAVIEPILRIPAKLPTVTRRSILSSVIPIRSRRRQASLRVVSKSRIATTNIEAKLNVPAGITALNLPHTYLRSPTDTTISRYKEDIAPAITEEEEIKITRAATEKEEENITSMISSRRRRRKEEVKVSMPRSIRETRGIIKPTIEIAGIPSEILTPEIEVESDIIKPTGEIPGLPPGFIVEEEETKIEPPKPFKPVIVKGIHVHMVQPVEKRQRPPRTRPAKDDPFAHDLLEMKISTKIPHAATFQPHRVSHVRPTPLPVAGAPLSKPTLDIRKSEIDLEEFSIQPINIPIIGERLFVKNVKDLKILDLPIKSSKIMKPTPLTKLGEVRGGRGEEKIDDIDISMISLRPRGESYTVPQLINFIKKYSTEKIVKRLKKDLVQQLLSILRVVGIIKDEPFQDLTDF